MFYTVSGASALILQMASESNLFYISYTTLLNIVFNFKLFILIPRFPLTSQLASGLYNVLDFFTHKTTHSFKNYHESTFLVLILH